MLYFSFLIEVDLLSVSVCYIVFYSCVWLWIFYTYSCVQFIIPNNIFRIILNLTFFFQVLLESLTPRLGYPYVYIHHGNCEHIIAFSDARLVQPCDPLITKKYPRVTTMTRSMKPLCFICNITHSRWIVKDCNRFPQDKVFLCTECCESYLYIDGEKVGDFKLYPYYDVCTENV